MTKVYVARPISGGSREDIEDYFNYTKDVLRDLGFEVFIPTQGTDSMRTDIKDKETFDGSPLATNHAIVGRDSWFVRMSDIVYVNLLGATRVSIGCVMELAWAFILGKHTVVVMEKDNIHRHAFVMEAGAVIFDREGDAISYFKRLAGK